MLKLTKEKAQQLDKLFGKLAYYKQPNTRTDTIRIKEVYKEIESLKDKDEYYIEDLLYIARFVQKEIPTLFNGNFAEGIVIIKVSVRDFIRSGGFFEYWKKKRNKEVFDWIQFALIVISAILAALALL